ncbi:MAG: tryptophan 2,3-dioxygenase [Bdellovibrionales bacterium]|nr:tryptophan 2,3-dioxygenase [Bdellovibrionales bacterium]
MSDGALDYGNYLKVDEIISLQELVSEQHGKPAHIEMLYIVVHQVYELWFKEILHELGSVIEMFDGEYVNEKNIGEAVKRLKRITAIQSLLVEQIKVLETMTPLEFLDFRKYLGTASGFQSYQFRILENRLGLKPEERIPYAQKSYLQELSGKRLELVKESENQTSMFEAIAAWLERTPFLELSNFKFVEAYRAAANQMLDAESSALDSMHDLPQSAKTFQQEAIDSSRKGFAAFLDFAEHERLVSTGQRRLSFKATMAALFINVYRDEPILQLPFQLLETLVEIDENFTIWRSRHAVMVHRMLGRKVGTGQSSGYDYLKRTVDKYRVFTDLFNISTFLIPRSELPRLPEDLKIELGFHYSATKSGS